MASVSHGRLLVQLQHASSSATTRLDATFLSCRAATAGPRCRTVRAPRSAAHSSLTAHSARGQERQALEDMCRTKNAFRRTGGRLVTLEGRATRSAPKLGERAAVQNQLLSPQTRRLLPHLRKQGTHVQASMARETTPVHRSANSEGPVAPLVTARHSSLAELHQVAVPTR